jgi:hypothetical protein
MASLYDLLGADQPAQYDIYDAPGMGISPALTPTAEGGAGRGATNSMMQRLMQLLASQRQPQPAVIQNQAPQMPALLPPAGQASQSSQGFLSNSKHGVDLGTIMKLAAIAASAGAAAPAVAGATGAAGAAGAGAGAASGGGAMGMMGMFGNLLGGMGGGQKPKQTMQLPTFQPNTSPLIPRGVDLYQTRQSPSLFG